MMKILILVKKSQLDSSYILYYASKVVPCFQKLTINLFPSDMLSYSNDLTPSFSPIKLFRPD